MRFFLVGIDRLIEVDVEHSTAKAVLTLNRSQIDDRGWYYLKGLTVEDGILVLYEGGVFCISQKGILRWHTELMKDDVLIGNDDLFLRFWSEFRTPQEFRIDITSGAVKNGL